MNLKNRKIFVYLVWDFANGYWLDDNQENRDKIDASDSYFWMSEKDYFLRI